MKTSNPADRRFDLWLRSNFENENLEPPRPMGAAERLEFVKKLFGEFDQLMARYPVDSVAAGLERLIDPGGNEDMHALSNDELPAEDRISAISSLSGLLRYFEAYCQPLLSHNSDRPHSPLNRICYSWWDIFPAYPLPSNPMRKPIEIAFLRHMSDALKSESPAVQEYGLHGLGHWHHDYPKEVEAAVDDYLNRNPQLGEIIKSYALSARDGTVR